MGIDCTGMGGNGNVKNHSRASLVCSQLNAEKTELIWFGSRANLSRLSGHDLSIRIGSETIKPENSVRDLGFRLDNELSMKQHMSLIARTCFYHLRRLRQIRRRAGYEVTVRLVPALIMSRVDFCNALFASLPASTISPLQSVQMQRHDLFYNSDRVATYLKDFVSSTGYRSVHESSTNCGFLCTTFTAADHRHTLKTLSQHAVQPHGDLVFVRPQTTIKPRLSTKFGEHVFSYAHGTIFLMI